MVPVVTGVGYVAGAVLQLVGALGRINPLLPVVVGALLWFNRALIADLISLRAMPVAGWPIHRSACAFVYTAPGSEIVVPSPRTARVPDGRFERVHFLLDIAPTVAHP